MSGSTQNQSLNALLFLYHHVLGKEIGYVNGVVRAKKAPRLPVVLTRGEIQALLSYLNGSEKIMATFDTSPFLLINVGRSLFLRPLDPLDVPRVEPQDTVAELIGA